MRTDAMTDDGEEEQRLRETALKNMESIPIARSRAERELVEARDALRLRTEELEQQREWFQVALASIGDAVITTDVNAAVTFLNPVAESMTGWSTAEAKGQALSLVFRLVNEDTGEAVDNPVLKVLESGVVVELANHSALISRHGTHV